MESKKMNAHEARALQTQLLLKRYHDYDTANDLGLPAPVIEDGDFLPTDNLITSDTLDSGFKIRIKSWGYANGDKLSLYLGGTLVYPDPTFEVKDYKDTTDVYYQIAPWQINVYSGKFNIYYGVKSAAQPNIESGSGTLTITVDRSSPNGNAAPGPLKFPDGMNNTVTLKYLADHEDKVIVKVPAYAHMEAGQTVTLWWNGKKMLGMLPVEVSAQDVIDNEVSIEIPGDSFRNSKDEKVALKYTLTSRAGFEGKLSEENTLIVSLLPDPTNLPDPIVPLAADGLIDLEDANQGVMIQIDTYENVLVGDTIIAYWGGLPLRHEIESVRAFPIFIPVPRKTIIDRGSGQIPVNYQVLRGGLVYPSNILDVKVDVGHVGPPIDPDPTTPVNEALPLVSIKGGSNLYPINHLGVKDGRKAAIATIPFYQSSAGQPDEPIITQVDAQIMLVWGAQSSSPINIGPVTVLKSHLDSKTLPEITIPSDIVDTTHDSKDFQVFYQLIRPATNPVGNPVSSPSTSVVVALNPPGGLDGLKSPEIQDLTSTGWLVKDKIENTGVSIMVKPYSGMEVGDKVEINWTAFSSTDNTPGTEIDGSKYTDSKIVTAVALVNGVLFTVPYSPNVELILAHSLNQRQGSATALYTVTQDGQLYDSPPKNVPIELAGPGRNS